MDKRTKTIAAVVAVTLLLCVALRTTLSANRDVLDRLSDVESTLAASDQNQAKSIEDLLTRADQFMILSARQAHPRAEFDYLIEEYKKALEEFLEPSRNASIFPSYTARARLSLARLLILQGNRNAARELLEDAIDLAASIGDSTTVAKAKNTLGCLIAADGEYLEAFAAFGDCSTFFGGAPGNQNTRSIAMRNMGLAARALGRDGTASLRGAIALIEQAPDNASWGFTAELLQDLRMTLCEVYWSQGKIDEAAKLACQTLDDLESKLVHADLAWDLDKHLLARNRYVTAQHLVQRNLDELRSLQEAAKTNAPSQQDLGKTAIRWQWNPLFDLSTEMVSAHLSVSGTMVGEFEQQSGLVVTWGSLSINHSAVTEIAKATYDRTQLVIVSDLEESLDEAKSALEDAGVPLDRIRFGISDCEAPWLRDQGPIVARSATGDSVWFDSKLTREDRAQRTVLDALPRTLRRNWKTRVADTPIHVEGGMLLSNGKGLTIGAASIVSLNQRYGFSDETMTRELRRITGSRKWHFVDTLIGEPTQHVDLFLTFVSPTTVIVGDYDDPANPNAALLDEIASQLKNIVFDSKPLKVARIPMPQSEPPHFPSYTNVVFANGVLLVPSYDTEPEEKELRVRQAYESLLPDWDVRFIDCSQLRTKGGALHCLVSNLGDTPFTPVYSPKQ